MDNLTVGVMIIQCAISQPVTFQKVEYIRVGSYTKRLLEYPALQSKLWGRLHNRNFEEQPAAQDLDLPTALRMLDHNVYFDLIEIPQPTSADNIAHYMLEEGVLSRQDNGMYAITNMGAILFAKRLADFPKLSRKAIRVVQFEGNNRLKMLKVDIRRIVDNPPKSRNERLASLMRRLRMCEELGTGWDKIVISCELQQLPTPRIELYEESTRVTIFSEIPFTGISLEDKLWACYMHACILHVQGEQLTNASLRGRFGVPQSSSGSISRLIKEAVEANLIKPLDPTTSNKYMKYVPFWA